MVTCQSSELGWEVTVELPTDFLSLGRGSVKSHVATSVDTKGGRDISQQSRHHEQKRRGRDNT